MQHSVLNVLQLVCVNNIVRAHLLRYPRAVYRRLEQIDRLLAPAAGKDKLTVKRRKRFMCFLK